MTKHFIRPLHTAEGSTHCSVLEVESRYAYPGMVFFYREPLDEARLRHTLAQVLDDFPQYAGKLIPSAVSLEIRHGQGVVVFEAERSAASLQSLMNDVRAGRTARVEPRVSKLGITLSREVPLSVRFVEARDGCALALVWNHAIGDMHSTMLLMRAWAKAYAGRHYDKPLLVPDRDAYLRATVPNSSRAGSAARRSSYSAAFAQRARLMQPATIVGIEYSWQQLRTLRDALRETKHITLNDAVCGHVYGALRQLSGATERTNLCLVVNYRKRLGLPDQLVGNMTSLLTQPVDEFTTPAQTAAGLREGLDHYATQHADYHATLRVFEANTRARDRLRLVSRQYSAGTGDLLVTSWCNFGAYELSFATSTPELFFPIILGSSRLPQWFMIVYELPADQGLGLAIGLPSELARRWSSAEGQALLRPQERGAAPRRPELILLEPRVPLAVSEHRHTL